MVLKKPCELSGHKVLYSNAIYRILLKPSIKKGIKTNNPALGGVINALKIS